MAGLLNGQRVPHIVVGGWALGVWGSPRATLDFDFLVMAEGAALEAVGDCLVKAGARRDRRWSRWNPMLKGVQVRLTGRGIVIDLMAPRDEHDLRALHRRRRKRVGSRYMWFVAPEDFVLQKLKVGRPRDFEDASSVLQRCRPRLDKAYLRRWATRLNIGGELDYVLSVGR